MAAATSLCAKLRSSVRSVSAVSEVEAGIAGVLSALAAAAVAVEGMAAVERERRTEAFFLRRSLRARICARSASSVTSEPFLFGSAGCCCDICTSVPVYVCM